MVTTTLSARPALAVAAIALFMAVDVTSPVSAATGPTGPAAGAAAQWFASDRSLACVNPDGQPVACSNANQLSLKLFYGNGGGGAGTPDALAVASYLTDTTGNAVSSAAAVFRQDAAGRFRLVRRVPDQIGEGPAPGSHVLFANGQAVITVVTARPGDSRCCPTGRKKLEIALGPR